MVHRAGQQRATAARAAIAGGFVLVDVPSLMAAWHACRSGPLGVADFRAWLACHEAGARRQRIAPARAPAYRAAELARLLGVAERRARASLRRLDDAGLLRWSESAIDFPGPATPAPGPEDTIGRGRGALAIPRRVLRLLAHGARPALIATALGVLLRCLSRRQAGHAGRGRIKASWVAQAFGVDRRRVKQARLELVALGWIAPLPSGQRAENRWGRAYRVDLAWPGPPAAGRRLPPPPAGDRPEIATPSVDQEPLPGRESDQEPAGRGPAGFETGGRGARATTATPAPAATPAPPPSPRLEEVRPEDLEDTGRLLELHRQAVDRGLVTASEADRLGFVAAAEHARAVGRENPPGLFAYLVRGRCWRHATAGDEDRANARIKAHLRGPGPPEVEPGRSSAGGGPRRPPPPEVGGLSEDARLVREVRREVIRAGVFRDPWPAFAGQAPGWDRDRWDRALGELGLGR